MLYCFTRSMTHEEDASASSDPSPLTLPAPSFPNTRRTALRPHPERSRLLGLTVTRLAVPHIDPGPLPRRSCRPAAVHLQPLGQAARFPQGHGLLLLPTRQQARHYCSLSGGHPGAHQPDSGASRHSPPLPVRLPHPAPAPQRPKLLPLHRAALGHRDGVPVLHAQRGGLRRAAALLRLSNFRGRGRQGQCHRSGCRRHVG
ncbi:hypothetical protein VUR80DRAFT_7665 [Thermomyces stellatus]